VYCDHTPAERGQTYEEMMRPLTVEELKAWRDHPDGTGYIPEKMAVARKYQHHVFTEEDKMAVEAYDKECKEKKEERIKQKEES
jgi:hypothetical protein